MLVPFFKIVVDDICQVFDTRILFAQYVGSARVRVVYLRIPREMKEQYQQFNV